MTICVEEFINNINKHYPTLKIREIRKLGKSTINDIFISENNDIVIKLFNTYSSLEDSIYGQILASVKNLAPTIYTNSTSSYSTEYLEKRYIVQKYISNRCTEISLSTIRKLIEYLIALHRELRCVNGIYQFKSKTIMKTPDQIHQEITIDKNRLRQLELSKSFPLFNKLLQLRQQLCERYNITYNPCFYDVIHGDIRPSNVLFQEGRVFFIDFDYICKGDLMYELGSAAMLFSNYNQNLSEYFINEYIKNSDGNFNFAYEEIMANLLGYYVQSSFPIKLIHHISDDALIDMIESRIKALEFCLHTQEKE